MQNGPPLSKAMLLTALGNSPTAIEDIAKRLFPAIPDGWLDEFRDEGGSSMLDRIRNHLAQLAQEGEIVCNTADSYSLVRASCSGRRTNPSTRKGVEEAKPQLAEYELTKVLGQGGMGIVYSGQHKVSGRSVAVKIQTCGKDDANARMIHEAHVMSALDGHPGFVDVFSMGLNHCGRRYLVMELIDGEALSNCMHDDLAQSIGYCQQIAQSMAYAHAKGIVHRDLKPENILVTRDGRVKIIDLGLSVSRDLQRLTGEKRVVGTPAYMAPEMWQGRIGPAGDVYALGVMVYEVCAGLMPFERGGPLKPARTLRNDLPKHLDALCTHLLSVRPEDRPSMADAAGLLALSTPSWLSRFRGWLEGARCAEQHRDAFLGVR